MWQTDFNADHGRYTVRVTAYGPEGVTSFVEYDIVVIINCSLMVVTTPSVQDLVYTINEPSAEYEVAEFANDEPLFCPLTYTVNRGTKRAFLKQIDERKIQWYSTDNADYGVYTIVVAGACTDPLAPATWEVTFTLTVVRDCTKQVLTPPAVVA